jgi:hypothetical protein
MPGERTEAAGIGDSVSLEFQPLAEEASAVDAGNAKLNREEANRMRRFAFLAFELATLAVPVVATFLLQRCLDIISFGMARPT